jgi:hypothetical protein
LGQPTVSQLQARVCLFQFIVFHVYCQTGAHVVVEFL